MIATGSAFCGMSMSAEESPLDQRNPHRPEVVGRRCALIDLQLLPGLGVHPSTLIDPQPTDDVNGSDETAPRAITPGTLASRSLNSR